MDNQQTPTPQAGNGAGLQPATRLQDAISAELEALAGIARLIADKAEGHDRDIEGAAVVLAQRLEALADRVDGTTGSS